jgi:predicted nucleic acid-binding protein
MGTEGAPALDDQSLRAALIDTDILVDASRGIGEAGQLLDVHLRGDGITISAVSAMELVAGCRDAAQLKEVKEFLSVVRIVPISEAVSERAQSLMEAYSLSHGLLLPDALIAATALQADLALCTRNVRHFSMIADLHVVTPY